MIATVVLIAACGPAGARASTIVDASAVAAPPGLEVEPRLAGPALTASEVIWGRPDGRAFVTFARRPGAPARVLRVTAPERAAYGVEETALTAGSDVVAVNEVAYTSDKYMNVTPIYDRLLAGPGGGPLALIAGCTGGACLRAGARGDFRFAADGSRLAYAGEVWTDPAIVVLDLASGATRSVRPPRPQGSAAGDLTLSSVRLAGDFLAWRREAGGRAIVVLDLVTGRIVQEIGPRDRVRAPVRGWLGPAGRREGRRHRTRQPGLVRAR